MAQVLFRLFHAARAARITARLKAIMATLGCIVCARSRIASAFSTLSARLTAYARLIHHPAV